jgi:hypothetical protein
MNQLANTNQIRKGTEIPDDHPLRVANPESFRMAGWNDERGCQMWKLRKGVALVANNEEIEDEDGLIPATVQLPPGHKIRDAKWWYTFQFKEQTYNENDYPPQAAVGRFLEQVSLYGIFDRAARHVGHDPIQFHKMFELFESFTAACKQAMNEFYDEVRFRITLSALDGYYEPVIDRGNIKTWIPKIDAKALARLGEVHLQENRSANGIFANTQKGETGVMVVPPPMTEAEWEKAVSRVKLPPEVAPNAAK